MNRRSFLSTLTALLGAGGTSAATLSLGGQSNTAQSIELQRSPIAGFQYHDGETVWSQLRVADALQLIREAGNVYDPRAVRVEWQGHILGYVPRLDNATISHLLDHQQNLQAYITALEESRNPWQRVTFTIHLAV
jgi:hypothetical protein